MLTYIIVYLNVSFIRCAFDKFATWRPYPRKEIRDEISFHPTNHKIAKKQAVTSTNWILIKYRLVARRWYVRPVQRNWFHFS